ncbi:hypothetical protein [Leekyejoonella antrihumi]|uniref:Uncharacterized protein n=1 Tax=Leekyejoonella antrihumi TaxID=1660198 RepID=A0A563DYK0_9MICO|nr:hypothetical protein [Leekyejoonella antrihumi]TWP35320.1 hypothetical protein FGL98_14510 [Leekyejoonella antrihumi]
MVDAVAEIQAARAHTLSAGTARIACSTDRSWSWPSAPADPGRSAARRAGRRAAKTVGKALGKGAYRLATRNHGSEHDPFHQEFSEGVIDLIGRRSMIRDGNAGKVQIGAEQWFGRSGRARKTMHAEPARVASPLWLVDLLGGIVRADDQGVDDVGGEQWRHFAVTVNLAVASAAVDGGMPSPRRDRLEDLLALPVEVWLDATDLRRIRYTESMPFSTAVDAVTLSDFGVDVEDLDWSRIPSYRSPGEAQ